MLAKTHRHCVVFEQPWIQTSSGSFPTNMSDQGTGPEISRRDRVDRLLRIGDIVVACALGLLILPLFGLVALAIRLESSGRVFCRCPRRLPDGRRVSLVNFRTTSDKGPTGYRGFETHVGSFLRYTRIEHLPQLINVVRGEMTLTGADRLPPFLLD
jgi:lipopolysaccharide/colanic/teichoic acid biosynthesis glycosyltransferase